MATILWHDEAIRDWALGLCLLSDRLIGELVISSPLTKLGLNLRLTDKSRTAAELRSDTLSVHVSETELGFWVRFFLEYVRDGFGPVDHIDVQSGAPDIVWEVQKYGRSRPIGDTMGRVEA